MTSSIAGADLDEALVIARQFAAEQIEPQAADWERERRLPRAVFQAAGSRGLCALLVPLQYGGAGLSATEFVRVMECLAYSDMGFTFALLPHNNLANALAREASEPLRRRYLDELVSGTSIGAFLLTEPKAGTDASAIITSAMNLGDRWLLNGDKVWVTNAAEADLLRVYAQTRSGAGARGIAAFLVRADQQGVVRKTPYEMLGAHATGAGGFFFDNVELEPEQLLSPPGVAYRAAMSAIVLARVVVAGMCVGILRRGLDVAVDHLHDRSAFGSALSGYQGLRWMLADVATDIEASAALVRQAARATDSGDAEALLLTAHAKKFAARAALDGLGKCMQALGASGFRQDQPLARHFAAAKMAHYLDGTTEAQNLVIAKALFD